MVDTRAYLALAITVCLVVGGRVSAGTHYVSSNGADANDGRSPTHPWRTLVRVNAAELGPGDRVLFRRGDVWRGSLRPKSGAEDRPVVYGAYGVGLKPVLMGSVAMSSTSDWHGAEGSVWWAGGTLADGSEALPVDVGNLIFGNESGCGWKVWKLADVNAPGRFWYDARSRRVYVFSDKNPAERFGRIECALYRHIIVEDGCSYVIYENLALKYGGAHGIGGGGTHHIVARDLDISYIGGADQFGGGRTVRFGNGIEFWGDAHDNLVERCRLWEIYDAALTNQNLGAKAVQTNITYRNNIIWNCEYSFEYWNRPAESVTENILFAHNTCVDAGHGWGHAQRPDPSGRHLCFYASEAQESGIVVADNIFDEAAANAFYSPDSKPEALARLRIDGNLWWQRTGVMAWVAGKSYTMSDFARYQSEQGFDRHSVAADPGFRNLARHDYRLSSGSPCVGAGVKTDVRTDFRGHLRREGRGADIGALQHDPER